mmetsp:Transcript_4228/g.8561  ORF Transcript_4228/g.8561 Transcript_4228/m.8561 type:complete len:321 (+) Transcript_4228:173-1135(+)
MSSVELFQEPVRRRYYAPYNSCSYLFFVITVWVLVALPFFLCYSENFWLKTNTYREQVANKYEYKVIIEGSGVSPSDSFFYSSVPDLNRLHGDAFRPVSIKTREEDKNLDTIADSFEFTASIPIPASSEIRKLDCLVFFRTQLQTSAKIVMESVVHISHDSGVAGKELLTSGNLVFQQNNPLFVKGGYTTMYANTELVDSSNILSAKDGDIKTILEKVTGRNYTMTFEPQFAYWGPKLDNLAGTFTLKAKLNIPTQDILYTPKPMEVLKDAWIKYLSMFVVVGFFLEKLCSFVYFHQLVETKMLVETMGSQSGVPHFKKF